MHIINAIKLYIPSITIPCIIFTKIQYILLQRLYQEMSYQVSLKLLLIISNKTFFQITLGPFYEQSKKMIHIN